jgi:hypothetical protein
VDRPHYPATRLDEPPNPLPARLTLDDVADAIDWPHTTWYAHCHEVSHAIVTARLIPHARVARGTCAGVPGQHSWIVAPTGRGKLGDCYADNAVIIDPTLSAYRQDVAGIYTARADEHGWHRPFGKGDHIMNLGRPPRPETGQKVTSLAPEAYDALSADARFWVNRMFGPLDRDGWFALAHTSVIGWPAEEIIRAMHLTPGLRPIVPVDIVGMLTNLDPCALYLHPDDVDPQVAAERTDGDTPPNQPTTP